MLPALYLLGSFIALGAAFIFMNTAMDWASGRLPKPILWYHVAVMCLLPALALGIIAGWLFEMALNK